MEAHSELLLQLYAQARGRGAEYYGADYLTADRWVRTNGIPETAKKWAAGQSVEFGPLKSFVRGLNAWAAEHKADLSAEAQRVLPVSVEDVYAHCLRVIHYDWIINPAKLSTRLARADVETHGSNEWAIAASRSATGKAMLMSNRTSNGVTSTPTSKCSSQRQALRCTARCGSAFRCCVSASPSTWVGPRRRIIPPSRICIASC